MKYLFCLIVLLIGLYSYGQSSIPKSSVDTTFRKETQVVLNKEQLAGIVREEVEGQTFWRDIVASLVGAAIGLLGAWGFKSSLKTTFNNKLIAYENKQRKRLEVIDKEVEYSVLKAVNAEASVITKTFAQTRLESQLKINTKLKILNPKIDGGDVNRVLRAFNINHKNITENEDYDLLIINNQNAGLGKKNELDQYVDIVSNLGPHQMAFYYNDTNDRFPSEKVDKARRGHLNFATNPSQIYSNLLGSLFYLEALK